jgi:hypothetical protein
LRIFHHTSRFTNFYVNAIIHVEIGETGSMVKDPQMVKLTAGEKFPDNTNHNRQSAKKYGK